MTTHDEHAAQAEAAWAEFYATKRNLHRLGMQVVAELEPISGLQAHPGAEKLIDSLVDLFVDLHADVEDMDILRARARAAEAKRDQSAPAPPPPPPGPTTLDALVADGGDNAVREWLKGASEAEVADALAEENAEDRRLWATEMLGAARADGNTHDVLALLAESAGEDGAADTMAGVPAPEDA